MFTMPAEQAVSEGSTPLSAQRQVVLVVDDEPDILTSIKTFLEGAIDNVHVETATSGPAALDYVQENAVDLILSDYRMPEMNGLELLAKVREHRSKVPRIIITAYPDLELAIDAINNEDVERFFTKPLDPLQIVQTVQEILHAQRSDAMRKRAYARALNMLRKERKADRSDDEPVKA